MDERIEHGDDTPAVASGGIGRREMLQRTGFLAGAAAVAWVAPSVHTVGSRAAAATNDFDQRVCVDENGNIAGQPTGLSWQLTLSSCTSELNDSWKELGIWPQNTQENVPEQYGNCCDLSSYDRAHVDVWAVSNLGAPSGTPDYTTRDSNPNGLENNKLFSYSGIFGNGKVGPNNVFRVTPLERKPVDDPDPVATPTASTVEEEYEWVEVQGCKLEFGFHTSCSRPLFIGDRFLSITLTGFSA